MVPLFRDLLGCAGDVLGLPMHSPSEAAKETRRFGSRVPVRTNPGERRCGEGEGRDERHEFQSEVDRGTEKESAPNVHVRFVEPRRGFRFVTERTHKVLAEIFKTEEGVSYSSLGPIQKPAFS